MIKMLSSSDSIIKKIITSQTNEEKNKGYQLLQKMTQTNVKKTSNNHFQADKKYEMMKTQYTPSVERNIILGKKGYISKNESKLKGITSSKEKNMFNQNKDKSIIDKEKLVCFMNQNVCLSDRNNSKEKEKKVLIN